MGENGTGGKCFNNIFKNNVVFNNGGSNWQTNLDGSWPADSYNQQMTGAETPVVREFHSRYYAVTLATLENLLRETGFGLVVRRDEHFFQPLLVAINPPAR